MQKPKVSQSRTSSLPEGKLKIKSFLYFLILNYNFDFWLLNFMSGHSKWAQIKRQKGAADVKRGKVFSRLANAITLAAKQGGGDPASNIALRLAVEMARKENMPKENIERAIGRGTGEIAGEKIEEILYEAYGPGGIAILIEAATDKRNRANSEIKNVLSKFGGRLGETGSVSYLFEKQGLIRFKAPTEKKEEIELAIIDAGAKDFVESDEEMIVYTDPRDLYAVKSKIENLGMEISEAILSWEPKNTIEISDPAQSKQILALMDALDELEDVSNVFSNFDIK